MIKAIFFRMKYTLLLFTLCSTLFAAYTQIDGVWYKQEYAPQMSASEHFDTAKQQMKAEQYDEALRQYLVVLQNYPQTVFFTDALFQAGVCYMHIGHLDIADEYFAAYLNQKGTLKHFEQVFEHKFAIAEKFRAGKRRHPYGIAAMPRFASGKGYALELYDEIAATLPAREIAAKALYSKGLFLRKMYERKEAIEVFQTITRRFPKHRLAAESFMRISEVYLDNVQYEAQDPDLLALAQLNLQNFENAFPSEGRISVVEENLHQMRERYARALFDTARFYEKKKKKRAAEIYYRDMIARYPSTETAEQGRQKLAEL
ncbi:MAG: tetratricopeptide repeat protein [Chlamydiae bacterium]|nr:tetratricopeptide repeat protein [Chlamydiota bacterium]